MSKLNIELQILFKKLSVCSKIRLKVLLVVFESFSSERNFIFKKKIKNTYILYSNKSLSSQLLVLSIKVGNIRLTLFFVFHARVIY